MASTIDPTKPVVSSLLDSAVIRANFQAAYNDITALQSHTNVGVPTVAAGLGMGVGPTISITGNDNLFRVTCIAGTATLTVGTLFVVTFGTAFASAPLVMKSPASQAAFTLDSASFTNGTATTTQYTLAVNGTAPTVGSTYVWTFQAGV